MKSSASLSSAATVAPAPHEIAPGVWHFATPPFNWYVLHEAGRLTVVDCGFPAHFEVLERELSRLGLSVRDVDAIVITHAHADHMGFARRLSEVAKAPVYVHRDDRAAAARILQLPWLGLLGNAWRGWGRHILFSAIDAGILRLTRIPNAIELKGGEVLDIPGRPRILSLPGHTPGQIALFCEGARTLLAGDALLTQNLLTGEESGPQLGPRSLTWDSALARTSLQSLRRLGPITLATGHGRVWRGLAEEAVELALRPPDEKN